MDRGLEADKEENPFVAISDEGVYRLMKWSPPRVAARGRG